MRINKFIANCINVSRRNADRLIKDGRIKVNGKTIIDFIDINLKVDIVQLDGRPLRYKQDRYYFAFYKPPFVLSATKDSSGKAVVCDYFKEVDDKLICVGRLDYLSEGLLIVTNDGDFAQKIIHPRFKIKKTYLVKTKKPVDVETLRCMAKGVKLEDGFFRPLHIKKTSNPLWTIVSIDSGRNRILRRFFKFFDIPILKLKRISVGNIELGDLKVGKYRNISQEEIQKINY